LPECQWSSPTENRGVGHRNKHHWVGNRFSDQIVFELDAEWLLELDAKWLFDLNAEWILELDLQRNFVDEPDFQQQLVGRCHAAAVLNEVA